MFGNVVSAFWLAVYLLSALAFGTLYYDKYTRTCGVEPPWYGVGQVSVFWPFLTAAKTANDAVNIYPCD